MFPIVSKDERKCRMWAEEHDFDRKGKVRMPKVVWGSKRGGHGVPKEVRPLKGQGVAGAERKCEGLAGSGGWRKLCWDPVYFLNKTEARLAAGRKGGGEVLGTTRERRRMVL